LSNTDLDRAELNGTNTDNAKLIDTRLPRADLTGADLSGASWPALQASDVTRQKAVGEAQSR
jgi:uncharacterized protein YjbI with pentapeptide repeats